MEFLILQKLIVVLLFYVRKELVAVLLHLFLRVLLGCGSIHYVRERHHVYFHVLMI